jgi:hypothetical protein
MVRSASGSALALSDARLEPSGTWLLPSFETPVFAALRRAPQDEVGIHSRTRLALRHRIGHHPFRSI